MTVNGHNDARFDALRDTFAATIDSGEELGAALAIDVDGETVVDLWGGHRDAARTLPWESDTIVNVWSTTKEITALAILLCVDRGLVDLDAPVARYWPEFAANGKQDITVAQLMSHTSGVSGWDQPFAVEDMYDWDLSTSRLAAQAPWWEPGTASGYHAQNQGHLLGEVIRRVTGKHLKAFVAEEISGPLGTDLQIGAGPDDDARIAEIIPPPPLPIDFESLDPASPMMKTFTGPAATAEAANTVAWRRADMGALNGHTNARGLVGTLSLISRGSVGPLTLSSATIDRIFDEQYRGVDLVLAVPLRWGIGFGLPEPQTLPYIPDERICFWGGWGGSLTVMIPEKKTTISYVMNKMAPGIIGSDRAAAYLSAAFEALG
ncbi:beta-lactamase family protein [Gordonia sp. TBRC 11910]|uniref:Beta-lactamase family protein n=1 Tax=Gordonia asplenii TaxID=2725283 RepID=A0A848L032_9ACTN|nr:serine hydrolase domain-containing protein [Gordonia asplenii]NMO04186.1 beta-lactamase family protein [Gordonia asplenii]